MQVYRYLEEETSRFALTADIGGARLPAFGAVWLFAGPVKLSSEPPPVRVKAEILRKGYFLWPDDVEPRSFAPRDD